MYEVVEPASTFHKFIQSRPDVTVSRGFVLYPLAWVLLFWLIIPLNLPHCGWANLLPIMPMALFAEFCHELGHAFWAVRLGNEWLELNIEARRLNIVRENISPHKNWQIILAGPLASILVGLLYAVAGEVFSWTHHTSATITFFAAAVYVIVESFFNLLPLGHNDGAHLAEEVTKVTHSRWNCHKQSTNQTSQNQWDFTDWKSWEK